MPTPKDTPEHASEAAWAEHAKKANEAYTLKLSQWDAELDSFLFVSALLAGVTAAIVAITYPALTPSYPDASLLLLAQISAQLSSFAVNPTFANSTQPALTAPDAIAASTQGVSVAIILVNLLLSVSLVISIGIVSVCIRCKQWLRHLDKDLHGDSWETQLIRQQRRDGIYRWNIPGIILNIPSAMDWGIETFLLGLLILLWTYHPAVAVIPTLLVAALISFLGITMFLPTLFPECPYVSPHSIRLWTTSQKRARSSAVLRAFLALCTRTLRPLFPHSPWHSPAKDASPTEPCYDFRTWPQREREQMLQKSDVLRVSMLLTSYYNFNDTAMLKTARVCLRSLPLRLHIDFCDVLWKRRSTLYGRRTSLLWYPSDGHTRLALHLLDLEALSRLKEPVADEDCDTACHLLQRTLRIGETPFQKGKQDELFFPTVARFIQHDCPCDASSLALALLRNTLERPAFSRLGFSAGSIEVIKSLCTVAYRRPTVSSEVPQSCVSYFLSCALALRASSAEGTPWWTYPAVHEHTKSLITSLEAFLTTPLWRAWALDCPALRHYVALLRLLAETPTIKVPDVLGMTVVSPSLVNTFSIVAQSIDSCAPVLSSPDSLDAGWLDLRTEMLSYTAELERIVSPPPHPLAGAIIARPAVVRAVPLNGSQGAGKAVFGRGYNV